MSNKEEKAGDEVSATELRELCCEHLCYNSIEGYTDEDCVVECMEEWRMKRRDPCDILDEIRQDAIEREILCDEKGICI